MTLSIGLITGGEMGLGNLAVSQPSCLLRVAWQLVTERVLQLNDDIYSSTVHYRVHHFCARQLLPFLRGTWLKWLESEFTDRKVCGSNPTSASRLLLSRDEGPDRSAVAPFRRLATMPPEGSMRAGILSGCPSLDRGSREAEVGFEPWTFRSVNSRSNHLDRLATKVQGNQIYLGQKSDHATARRLKRLEREFTDRKVRGSNPTSASRLPLFRLGQPDSIPALAEQHLLNRHNRCLATIPPEGITRAEILPGCPSLDRRSQGAEVGSEPQIFRSVNLRSNH
ncbi:hypothetical protein T265_02423 [Opisthorchis viverrini]|uniref:Uncharacterized protein n=1 Tax=Opisthorchis viverrini TaxID=6198 RepID=A0A074ZV84_OPIVI|nr:hypothetical protein T265_02423 [Opisthorchis viverrini]KER31378.1 hypothetical protein T265_02423 [Opisthorchis viverrini]